MLRCIAFPTKGLALSLRDRRHASLTNSIIKSLGQCLTQRVRVACWGDPDQAFESKQGDKIGATCSIGAYELKSACECLALYDGEAFLTGSKCKNMGRFIKSLKLPLGN